MPQNVPLEGESDDYIYSRNEASVIAGASEKTILRNYAEHGGVIQHKEKLYNGYMQVFISASSLLELARTNRRVQKRFSFDSVLKYTPHERKDLIQAFEELTDNAGQERSEVSRPPRQPETQSDRSEVVDILKENNEDLKLEVERLNQVIREKDATIEQKNSFVLTRVEEIANREAEARVRVRDMVRDVNNYLKAHGIYLEKAKRGEIPVRAMPILPEVRVNANDEIEIAGETLPEQTYRDATWRSPRRRWYWIAGSIVGLFGILTGLYFGGIIRF